MTFCGLLMITLGRYPAEWISPGDPQIIHLTTQCLFITGFIQSGFAAALIFGGALRGAGDTLAAMAVSLCTVLCLRFTGVIVVGYWLHLGLRAVWCVLCGELFHPRRVDVPSLFGRGLEAQTGVISMGTQRIEAFSDGVIAVIITITVFNLNLPVDASKAALLKLLPMFLAYALSFVIVAIMWVNHHHMLRLAKHPSAKVMWANNFLLFLDVPDSIHHFIPGEQPQKPARGGRCMARCSRCVPWVLRCCGMW